MPRQTLIYFTVLICLAFGCSRTTLNMKNNNWTTRTYHITTSKYNTYFNGNEAIIAGIKKIEDQKQDDYSRVLPVFEDGNHESYSSIASETEYAIEKANKIIQLHSIKKKPKYNPKKLSDPEYKAWRAQEEFNTMIDDAYMLLGKAAFYKAEFIESIGIFNYVAVKYAGEDPWYLAHLWMARAYIEMGWLYEGENMLALVNDENLPYQYTNYFNLVNASLLIKQGRDREAIPYLKASLKEKNKRDKKQRYRFILAQIYQQEGEDMLAYEYYKKVLRSVPTYEMEFNSRIRMTEVMVADDSKKAIKKLNKMLRDPKNVDYKGQIYYALGNIYTATENRDAAIENYRLSMEFSTDLQKGLTSTTIASLYYNDELYQKSQPYYNTASNSLPLDYPNIFEINYRSKILDEMISYYDVMGEKDKEFQLASMSDNEKETFLENEEKEAKREEKIQKLIAQANGDAEEELALTEDMQPKGDWYFYNQDLVERGKESFRDTWGMIELSDNWRRSAAIHFNDDETEEEDYENEDETEIEREEEIAVVQDSTEIPSAEETILEELKLKAATDKSIVDAYFNLAALYQYDIENMEKAIETYETLESLYPNNPHSPDSYFAIYNAALEINDKQKAESAKDILLTKYSSSNYALILSDPNAKSILIADKKAYNTLYENTFNLFLKGKNHEVLANARQLKTGFRDSSLMPKIMLMETLATAKTSPSSDIRGMLTNIIKNYAYDEEISNEAQQILAQLAEGKEVNLGGSAANTLSERRNKESELKRKKILEEQHYKYEPESRHYMFIVLEDSININKNQLLYDLSRFNFNKFMTMDFDLAFTPLNQEVTLLLINGFSNEEEGKWYQSEFMQTNILDKFPQIKKIYTISEENFRLMTLLGTLNEYNEFDNIH